MAVIPPRNVDDASVWTSAEFLESILDNLVQNSVEAMNSNGRITLSWRFSNEEEELTFSLSDNGPGIEPEELGRILSGITLTSSKKGGTGVGMLTVVSMLRVLGGTICGASRPNEGATWTIKVPSNAPIVAPPLPDYDQSVKVAVE